MDDLDALRYAAEARAILAKAGRRDLAVLAWNVLCPQGVPIPVRHDALIQAGYPFRNRQPAGPAPRVFTWDYREQPDVAAIADAAEELAASGQLYTRHVETGSDQYAVVLSVGELTDEQARELYAATLEHTS